jgi:hypothetical protein
VDLGTAVRELAPKLLGYRRLETGDPSLAEEIAQDTLTALVHRWRTHGPPADSDYGGPRGSDADSGGVPDRGSDGLG